MSLGPVHRALAAGLGLSLTLQLAETGRAQSPVTLHAYPELVRLDEASGVWLEAARSAADLRASTLSLEPLRLEAERDEVVAFTLRVSGPAAALPVKWAPGAAPGGASTPVQLEVYEARAVAVTEPSAGLFIHSLGPGRYPDVLVPTSSVTPMPPPGGATLFIDVWVPAEAQPGVHDLWLRVGEEKIAIEVDVGPSLLPAEDLSGLGAVSFGSFQERLARDPEAFLAAVQLLHAHRFNVELISPWRPRLGPGGAPDWEGWADSVAPYLDGSAFTETFGYRGPRPGQPVTRFVVPVTEKWPSPPRGGRPMEPRAFVEALLAFEGLGVRRGFFRPDAAPEFVMFINDLDEPKTPEAFDSLASYAPLLEALEVRERIVFRVDGPFGARIPGWSDPEAVRRLAPVLDAVALCGGPPWLPRAGLDELERERPDSRLLFYASNTAGEPSIGPVVVDAPLTGLVAWGWIVRRNRLRGALNWELDFRPGCHVNPRCSGEAQNLDATLVYRAEAFGGPAGHIYPSWRLKALRRGAQDVALLRRLEASAPEFAERLVRLVIPHRLGEGAREGLGAWPQDPRSWARIRAALRAELRGGGGAEPIDRLRALERPLGRAGGGWLLFVLTLVLASGWLFRRLALRPRI